MTQEALRAEDEECPLCDGRGELEADTARGDRDIIGCPWCIQRDKDELIAELRAALSALPPQAEPVGWITPATVERLKMGEGNNYYIVRKTANGTHTIPLGYLAPPKPESPDNG